MTPLLGWKILSFFAKAPTADAEAKQILLYLDHEIKGMVYKWDSGGLANIFSLKLDDIEG